MNWFKRLTGGLNKTASGIKNSLGSIFKGNKLDVSQLESLEDQLISCDIGIEVSEKLVKKLGKFPLPVEVVPFGWEVTFNKLEKLSANPDLHYNYKRSLISQLCLDYSGSNKSSQIIFK